MNQKRNKIIYLGSTILLSAFMAMSIGMYFFNNEATSKSFLSIGFPAYMTYLLGIAKTLGLVAIWSKKSEMLKEWAYAGFFFTFVLAFSAHLVAQDGEFGAPLVALLLLVVSYIYGNKTLKK